MRDRKHSFLFVLVSGLLILSLSGCTTTLENYHWGMVEHPRTVVKYPARVGSTVGQIVGFPVTVALLPLSLALGRGASADDAGKVWVGFYPFVACRDTGAIIGGSIPWLLFGWWGNTEQPKAVSESRGE